MSRYVVRPPIIVHWVQFCTVTTWRLDARTMYRGIVWRLQVGRFVLLVMPRRSRRYIARQDAKAGIRP